mmetsp:Transcript_4054/g.5411  ORF Transcript_4054/g.5411 Transcript_4054/m.5411 type:complete len:89 (+) Transcript_4054:137-403(+)
MAIYTNSFSDKAIQIYLIYSESDEHRVQSATSFAFVRHVYEALLSSRGLDSAESPSLLLELSSFSDGGFFEGSVPRSFSWEFGGSLTS